MSVTGPGGFVSHLNNIQAVGTKRRRGADKLFAATGTISGMSNGSEYHCLASNEETSHRNDSIVLTGIYSNNYIASCRWSFLLLVTHS